jgi:hypothetical protein
VRAADARSALAGCDGEAVAAKARLFPLIENLPQDVNYKINSCGIPAQ